MVAKWFGRRRSLFTKCIVVLFTFETVYKCGNPLRRLLNKLTNKATATYYNIISSYLNPLVQ